MHESRCHGKRESHSSSSEEEEAVYPQAVLDSCGISRTKLPRFISSVDGAVDHL